MKSHELSITIRTDGQVEMDVIGAKGPICEDYARLLQAILQSEAMSEERTHEYYEQAEETSIQDSVNVQQRSW